MCFFKTGAFSPSPDVSGSTVCVFTLVDKVFPVVHVTPVFLAFGVLHGFSELSVVGFQLLKNLYGFLGHSLGLSDGLGVSLVGQLDGRHGGDHGNGDKFHKIKKDN